MNKEIVGKFYAKTYTDFVLEFIVYSDNTMDCPTIGKKAFNRIVLKPRFVLFTGPYYYRYETLLNNGQELIETYEIDDSLFEYLKANRMIKYSTDMAYFYDFPDKNGHDKTRYGVGSPYKWAKKKGSILVKQKSGKFN